MGWSEGRYLGCGPFTEQLHPHPLAFFLRHSSSLSLPEQTADIRCHSCYKVPLLGCVDRQSCHLEPGQQCLTTNVYLGKMWVFSNLRCGTPEEPCREAFNQTNHKLGLTYNTTCCNKDNCNNPAPRPTPALALVLLTSLAGLSLWLLH
ncbi:lymphocyte antigen 6 complex locus protein G6c isoform X1 [Phocoena sinus]|uniref:lymphocyte antigen 6 complex locus protein G6c isoform X1 n=1 Tax=Phocoena sinus TaxID=42100 RepID=UPI0013C41DFE|nr:lymphocyte antigen 6 complex locus protein G6c isoform X1 [Phocoena sinus]